MDYTYISVFHSSQPNMGYPNCIECTKSGEAKSASFGFADKKPLYCSVHASEYNNSIKLNENNKDPLAYNVTKKYCKTHGKRLIFGTATQKNIYCVDCRDTNPSIIDTNAKKCVNKNCPGKGKYAAIYGTNSGIRERCHKCRTKNDWDVSAKLCTVCISNNDIGWPDKMRALYGTIKPTHCGKHKTDSMTDKGNHMCAVCDKSRATHGLPGTHPVTCSEHKSDGYVDLNNNVLCIKCNKSSSTFGPFGGKRIHCRACMENGDVDLVHPMCEVCKVTQIHVTNRYDNHCQKCYMAANPDKTVTRQFRIKEKYFIDEIKSFLNQDNTRENILIENYDKTLPNSRLRPDVYIKIKNEKEFSLIVEFDEDCHRSYRSEIERERELYKACGADILVLLRFNPDEFGKHKACFIWNQDTKTYYLDKPVWEERMQKITDQLKFYLNKPPACGPMRRWYFGYC
jgi:hypothetical protein